MSLAVQVLSNLGQCFLATEEYEEDGLSDVPVNSGMPRNAPAFRRRSTTQRSGLFS